jgi:hypothetical protein
MIDVAMSSASTIKFDGNEAKVDTTDPTAESSAEQK